MHRRPNDQSEDLDRTDTLPMLVLGADDASPLADDAGPLADDTGTLAVPHLPPLEPSRHDRVEDDLYSATDSFSAATLSTPIAAKPVSVPDLAESLRERDLRLVEAGRRVQELDAHLAEADERCAAMEEQLARTLQLSGGLKSQLEQAGEQGAGLAAQLRRADERAVGLATQLEQAAQRCTELERQCAQLREASAASDAPTQAGAASQTRMDEIAALRRTNGLLHESISNLHGRLGVYEAMVAEAEEALHCAEAAMHAAGRSPHEHSSAAAHPAVEEAPMLVDWPARYAELETMLESERAAAASRLREQAGRIAALETLVPTPGQVSARAARTAAPASAASYDPSSRDLGIPMRVLIRVENGIESIYPLGRRTTIGRTPENDIQINTTYISRHHAVLLSSTGECIVEDLNSTNGLLVNGHRAGRQILQHGDVLTFGKTRFRFETRT